MIYILLPLYVNTILYSQHVQNKSAFLCGVMKIHRQRMKAAESNPNAASGIQGPPADKIKVSNLINVRRLNDI